MRLPAGFSVAVFAVFAWLMPVSLSADAPFRDMQEILVARVDDVDNFDAGDNSLVLFLASIQNQGATYLPIRTLLGPELCNPYLSGLAVDAWLESVVVAPLAVGPLAVVWVFPVENQSDYLAGLVRQGLSDSEGVDDVAVFSRIEDDGTVIRHYLEWLPGNIAVWGRERDAVSAVRKIYENAGAGSGLLGSKEARALRPDLSLRLYPSRLAAWQDQEAGVYWWRSLVTRLAGELIAYWRPETARSKLLQALAEDVAALPKLWPVFDLSLWLGEKGIEWNISLVGGEGDKSPLSDLSAFRRLPENIGIGYDFAVDKQTYESIDAFIGRILLGAAGGVVPSGARSAASSFSRFLAQAELRQAALAWLQPPPANPRLGSARILVSEWTRPELLDAAWLVFQSALISDGPVAAALSQIGWNVTLESPAAAPDCRYLTIMPSNADASTKPYLDAGFVAKRRGAMLAVVWGAARPEDAVAEARLERWRTLAENALAPDQSGSPDARQAFTLMGPAGATVIAVFNPIAFMQMLLAEAADWRIVSRDEPEPLSARLAREMYEYRDFGGAWNCVGQKRDGRWDFSGQVNWDNLRSLAAALGVSEQIALPETEDVFGP